MRPHPHLYEINTWPWLDDLSRRSGRPLTLGGVPDREWDALRDRGIDLVYLMGIWERSPFGRQIALNNPPLFNAFDDALPDWTANDVAGSAYCISGYQPDPRVGTWDDLVAVRRKLHARGMKLIVDFIPNHTGFDHPWLRSDPDRYVEASLAAFRSNPNAFRAIEVASGDVRLIACGRDPFFAPWNDVAQLDYSNPETRAAMVDELQQLSRLADGARCDMAMLVLSDVFGETWKGHLRAPLPETEFWVEARSAVPAFILLAEVYWDLEWRLQRLGFDFTYDKRLYDRLVHSRATDVRGHLMAQSDYQRRSARFIENHDEARSVVVFRDRVRAAATIISAVPGLRFFYQGQIEGRTDRLPVHLGRWRHQPIDESLRRFYDRLLAVVNDEVFHDGEWQLLSVRSAGDDSDADLVAWRWLLRGALRVVVVNLGGRTAQGLVQLSAELDAMARSEIVVFDDQLNQKEYSWSRAAIDEHGLYVRLEKGSAHVFRVTS
ncbi:MAG TPA: alpha-amylase family glycosyl hydrolase [Vicinamibacterales bacterium]|nr:alpha-amylase family glycosyl hydrolase [Vicinamibacterales bacterium]